ncbi:MAG TPA: DEAD/DEAH box helicase, partial [bacterium]|nr:DEAD/DEAH box helicase [bacterium]
MNADTARASPDPASLGPRPDPLAGFHPLVARWFAGRFAAPTAPQSLGWPRIASGQHVVIAAPTGSGKTLAAFLWSINRLILAAAGGELADRMDVIYVSPLKALGNDIERNLREPLEEIRRLAVEAGSPLPEIRVTVRSGDTPARDRARMLRRPPHILITTPESLYILLTAQGSRAALATARTVIIDEIHAVAGDKRGAHLALSLERLDALCGRRLQRIGLSATQRPIEEIAHLLVGAEGCAVADIGHRRALELRIEVPDQELGPITTHALWEEVYDRIVRHARRHRATLVFVNTRRQVERVAHALSARLGEGRVAAHHGSLSRPVRLAAEQRLKSGEVPVVVATASLELGIDIGHVDLVCHIGAPRSLATLLQRVGRSGHWLGAVPRGVFFPLTRDDLVQCAAAVRAVRAGDLDRTRLVDKPLDVLAQQMVAAVAAAEMGEEELWDLVRRAWPYRALARSEFEAVLEMLCEGVAGRRGRRGAHIHRDRVHGRLRPRRGARLTAITCGGAIPDTGDYDVVEEVTGALVGRLNEDFAIESQSGDIFLLGNTSWRIRRITSGRVLVENAHGLPPSAPFWLGEAPARTRELSCAVAELRAAVAERLPPASLSGGEPEAAVRWLGEETGLDAAGAQQLVGYIAATRAALGAVPTQQVVIAERFFDEGGGMQLVLHAPFGGRITRAWGLALRKRFCLTFDFELQAAATDDGLVLSLGEQHSFPLESVFGMVRRATLEDDLVQALLAAPMFANRWRWNATRALAVRRQEGGRRVPIALQRMRADDLMAAVFPEQVACGDNHAGPVVPPDHPLVNETIGNCLHEAMDTEGLRAVLAAIERGEIRTVAVETPAPSPMSHEILNANPYAFLDDAPLEERRARAVSLRRSVPELAGTLGRLDPAAVEEVQAQSWPDIRTPHELHDLLLTVGLLPAGDAGAWRAMADALVADGRAAVAEWTLDGREHAAYVAAERLPWLWALRREARLTPPLSAPAGVEREVSGEEAAQRIIRGWMECLGPATADALGARLGLPRRMVDHALVSLEASGGLLRGRFTADAPPDTVEWCDRRLLSRIHRLTLGRLRREIEPVAPAAFMRFLLRWQHLHPGTQLHGRAGVLEVITQLQGLELPATAWEAQVLPGRIHAYDPTDLEHLCLAGRIAWGRLHPPHEDPDGSAPAGRRRWTLPRQAPLAFVLRDDLPAFVGPAPDLGVPGDLGGAAAEVFQALQRYGASFLPDIARAVRMLPAQVEAALWELVARGLVSGDGIAGLRFLLRGSRYRRRRGGHHAVEMPLGRWALWRTAAAEPPPSQEKRREVVARQYLRRYGVVFREIVARETQAPPWRTLLQIYRGWEASGEIRGGRFVDGVIGEQYALSQAVEALRAVRRQAPDGETAAVAAADPLNLVGIVLPGPRVPVTSGHVIVYRDGLPVASGPLGVVRSHLQPVA